MFWIITHLVDQDVGQNVGQNARLPMGWSAGERTV